MLEVLRPPFLRSTYTRPEEHLRELNFRESKATKVPVTSSTNPPSRFDFAATSLVLNTDDNTSIAVKISRRRLWIFVTQEIICTPLPRPDLPNFRHARSQQTPRRTEASSKAGQYGVSEIGTLYLSNRPSNVP
ncbi:predicted protein [Coccidioides posadasii str. Silveira]|uniref:Predicted protein n=1 Tax=Coccidioides posadasii (strain RMSCC 757 / Silveira) TaxID=443226 RepID=E9DJ92_COCPS|nr:predicted protein [Coccidioides posadasii str. Silveira]